MEVPAFLYAVKHYHWIYRGQKQKIVTQTVCISLDCNFIHSESGKGWAYISFASKGEEGQKDLKGF